MKELERIYDRLLLNYAIKKCLLENGDLTDEKKEKLNNYIKEAKKEIRNYYKILERNKYLYHGENGEMYGKRINTGGDWDSFWEKYFFEGECWTEEEKREFIEDNWIHYKPSPYDCTGQVFTWSISCFNVPGGVVCYIRNALDV